MKGKQAKTVAIVSQSRSDSYLNDVVAICLKGRPNLCLSLAKPHVGGESSVGQVLWDTTGNLDGTLILKKQHMLF